MLKNLYIFVVLGIIYKHYELVLSIQSLSISVEMCLD